jgi:hypothetical protein
MNGEIIQCERDVIVHQRELFQGVLYQLDCSGGVGMGAAAHWQLLLYERATTEQ